MLLNKSVIKITLYTLTFIIVDQLVKWWMVRNHPSLILRNKGMVFGLVNNEIIVFLLLFTCLAILVWSVVTYKKTVISNQLSTSLIFAGVLSNIVDRLIHGGVVDYIDLGFWPAFNMADVFIVVGFLIFLVSSSYSKKNDIV